MLQNTRYRVIGIYSRWRGHRIKRKFLVALPCIPGCPGFVVMVEILISYLRMEPVSYPSAFSQRERSRLCQYSNLHFLPLLSSFPTNRTGKPYASLSIKREGSTGAYSHPWNMKTTIYKNLLQVGNSIHHVGHSQPRDLRPFTEKATFRQLNETFLCSKRGIALSFVTTKALITLRQKISAIGVASHSLFSTRATGVSSPSIR